MNVGLFVYFIYCEFMIDCHSLQRRDNVAYELISHSIFIFFVCYNKDNIVYESISHSYLYLSFAKTKR